MDGGDAADEREGAVSAALKEMMSTMLDTSFLICSGRDDGKLFPFMRKLQRYMASANSGNMRWPDLVVSASTLLKLVMSIEQVASTIPYV